LDVADRLRPPLPRGSEPQRVAIRAVAGAVWPRGGTAARSAQPVAAAPLGWLMQIT